MNITTVYSVVENLTRIYNPVPVAAAVATSIILGPAKSTAEFLAKLVLTTSVMSLVSV